MTVVLPGRSSVMAALRALEAEQAKKDRKKKPEVTVDAPDELTRPAKKWPSKSLGAAAKKAPAKKARRK